MSKLNDKLIKSITDKKAKIAIIGLGYVGLPLVIEFAKKGFSVTGFDVDVKKVNSLNKGKSYIDHIESSSLKAVKSKYKATTDFKKLKNMDAILICVPTPLDKFREPDMKYVFATGISISKNLKKGAIVILESTTYPGTTDEDLKAIIEEGSKLKAGKDFYLAFSPEREDPNNPDFSTSTIPKVVGGYTKDCLKAADTLYKQVIEKTVPVSSTKVAEASKLLENIYRSVNIALVNELKVLFDKMDIDVWEVIEAAKTKPFGFNAFYPGPGLGGHCIPIDPFYLTWKAKEYGVATRFIELAGEVNTAMPEYVVTRTMEALNEKGKPMKGAKILILGLAYKKDVDDIRESASLELIDLLEERGAKVDYNDPYIPVPPKMRRGQLKQRSINLTPANLKKYDCVLIATAHSCYDPKMILKNSKLIVDTRNLIPQRVKKVVRA